MACWLCSHVIDDSIGWNLVTPLGSNVKACGMWGLNDHQVLCNERRVWSGSMELPLVWNTHKGHSSVYGNVE